MKCEVYKFYKFQTKLVIYNEQILPNVTFNNKVVIIERKLIYKKKYIIYILSYKIYKKNIKYMLYTVTSKMSSRQFDLNLTSIRWI